MVRRIRTYPVVIGFAGLLLALVGCSLAGGESDPPWDTNVPESEAFDASGGAWGPEGERIVFVHTDDFGSPNPAKHDQLWVANLKTDERYMVAPGRIRSPSWSPIGKWVVFHLFSGRYLFKVDISGDSLVRLTGPGSPNPKLEHTTNGAWSPSGDRLLYAVSAGEPRGVSMMKPDGSEARILIPYGVMPSWFPDGERIVYASWDMTADEGRRKQIYRAYADGSGIEKLTDLPHSDHIDDSSVSPDGTQIAFVYDGEDGSTELHLMDADGTNIRQVTEVQGIVKRPEWRPGGDKILFTVRTHRTVNAYERLYLLDVETLEVEPVFPAREAQATR